LADYAKSYQLFRDAGCEIIAVSVDPPQRSAAMCRDLGIEFTVLSDASRRIISNWGLLNAREKGGIALPATFLIDRDGLVLFSAREDTSQRVAASEMLAFVKRMGAERITSNPRKRSIKPGTMFFRAIINAFRLGVRVGRK
jgi:thioredoxin-dependent peroxiredoxin